MRTDNRQYGVTLIELMIVVAIIGILASIAYPGYQQYVRRANRADAQAIMLENAQFMERYFTTNGTYAGANLPKQQSPEEGTPKYALPDPNGTATGYLIQAVPTGGYTDPLCGTLSINQAGVKTKAESATGSLADCWKS